MFPKETLGRIIYTPTSKNAFLRHSIILKSYFQKILMPRPEHIQFSKQKSMFKIHEKYILHYEQICYSILLPL